MPKATRVRVETKAEKPPRRREPFRIEERAIDTEEATSLNRLRARALAGARPGWGRLQAEAREHLGLDLRPLCSEFDASNRGYLPRGMVHLWIEPVIAHFTQHACWRDPVTEPVCGYARSLYVLGTALEQLRMQSWRAQALELVDEQRGNSKRALKRLIEQQEALRRAFGDQDAAPEAQAKLLADITKLAQIHERCVQFCDEALERHAGATQLLADREGDRPGLVFAEAELLAIPGVDPKRVGELIVELRNSSKPARQVRSRALLDTFELHLKIIR